MTESATAHTDARSNRGVHSFGRVAIMMGNNEWAAKFTNLKREINNDL